MNHHIIAAIIAVAVLGAAYLLILKRKVNPPTLAAGKPKTPRKPRHGKRRHK